MKDKADKSSVKNAEDALESLQNAVRGGDIDKIEHYTSEAKKASYRLSESAYARNTQNGGTDVSNDNNTNGGDKAVDAEYEVIDDDK